MPDPAASLARVPSSVGYETQHCGSNPASGQVPLAGPALALPCFFKVGVHIGHPGGPGPWQGATGGAPPASSQGTPLLGPAVGARPAWFH